jgi:hypothetical protein
MPRQTVVQAPAPTPVPTIDSAANDEEYSRKVRRRRGHMANKASAETGASVAARVLLG